MIEIDQILGLTPKLRLHLLDNPHRPIPAPWILVWLPAPACSVKRFLGDQDAGKAYLTAFREAIRMGLSGPGSFVPPKRGPGQS